jgi:hypothetical protein
MEAFVREVLWDVRHKETRPRVVLLLLLRLWPRLHVLLMVEHGGAGCEERKPRARAGCSKATAWDVGASLLTRPTLLYGFVGWTMPKMNVGEGWLSCVLL